MFGMECCEKEEGEKEGKKRKKDLPRSELLDQKGFAIVRGDCC